MSSIQERDHQYIAGTYARFPVTIVSGKGSIAVDENGREYIDMGTGIGVDVFGYGDEQCSVPWRHSFTKSSIHPTCITRSPLWNWHSSCVRRQE